MAADAAAARDAAEAAGRAQEAAEAAENNAAGHEQQITMLWAAIEKLSVQSKVGDCVPCDAQREAEFEAKKLSDLVGK